ncbi:SDR family oxidoreductase [Chelativorans sp.]|uniref:SDR family NAD(P)-dependent oxidoreductase n=1 Tax=Chelativorans sp. TaxID=2203393 RepID=UPI0028111A55|nr:SDR family oxidoreductase [Chelativorans sp.]
MDYGLEGKVALITGASSGIGKAIAKTFAEEGATVVINGRDQAKIDAALADIGGNSHGLSVDLTTEEGAGRLWRFASERGPVEYLINNLGIFNVREFFDISDAEWQLYWDVNVMTGIRMSRIALKEMLERNSGSILFTSSDAATKIVPWMIHYSLTKTAQVALARGMAELTKGTKVRVNSFMPGPTATDSVRDYFNQIAAEQGITYEEVEKNYFVEKEPTSLVQGLIDPANYGRGVVAMMTNPAVNGVVWRMEGGIIRSAF